MTPWIGSSTASATCCERCSAVTAAPATGSGRRPGRPSHIDDPDLAAAWDELEDYLDSDDPASGAGGARRQQHRPGDTGGDRTAAKKDPRAHLRADYQTLEVPFGAPDE